MTKEITKAHILQELGDKFKLREFAPANFLFDETVVPTYEIGGHLQTRTVESNTVSVTAGPMAYAFLHAPSTERWFLHRYNVIFITGVYTVAGVMIYRKSAVARYIYVDLEAAQSVSYAVDLKKDVVLDSNDYLYIYVDGYTSTGNLQLRADVTKEIIR